MIFQPSSPKRLDADERPILDMRRHGIVLLGRLLPPLVIFAAPLTIIMWSIWSRSEYPVFSAAAINLSLRALMLLAIPLLVSILYSIYDWQNDTFHVTSKRVIRSEQNFIFSQELKEANISQIQNVSAKLPNLLANLLNYGTVVIETAALAGKIEFDSISDPRRVQQLLFALRGLPQPVNPPAIVPEIRSLGDIFWFFFPIVPVVGEDGTITYHKHWYILLRAIAVPLFLLIADLTVAALSRSAIPLLALLLLIPALSYQYANWVNDVYILTADRIIDIVRIPLVKEDRREALLELIQNVNVSLPNFLSRLLDMGDVLVETAGKAENFNFQYVPHPLAVKDEINRRLDAARNNRKQADRQSRREELQQLLNDILGIQYGPPPAPTPPTDNGHSSDSPATT